MIELLVFLAGFTARLALGMALKPFLYKFAHKITQKLESLANRPVSDREATLYDHIWSEHPEDIRRCQVSACAGLA